MHSRPVSSQISLGVTRCLRGSFVTLLMLAALLARPALAVVVTNLYQARVPVASQSEADRGAALTLGLQQVLVKLSGQQATATNPALSDGLKNPAQYVDSYSYINPADATVSLQLQVSFVAGSVDRLLAGAGVAEWGDNRPAVLAWIAVDQAGQRELLGASSGSPLLAALNQEAQLRGLPLNFPLMDLEDSNRLSTTDVWGLFVDPAQQASARYSHDGVLLAKVSIAANGQWQGQWLLQLKDVRLGNSLQAPSADAWGRALVDAVTEALAAKYAVQAMPEAGYLTLEVSGVNSLNDYATLTRYLNSIAPVRSAAPLEVHQDVVRYRLDLKGDIAQLREYIALEKRLQRREVTPVVTTGPAAVAPATNWLYYKWQP